MTLRFRLVLALVALVAVGLAVFGIATYTAFSRVQYQRLDDQLRASAPFVTGQLYEQVEPGSGPPGPPNGGQPGAGPIVPSGTYAQLRDPSGAVVATLQPWDSTSQPSLPDDLTPPDQGRHVFSTGSTEGSGQWRVSVSPSDHHDGDAVVVAMPMDERHRVVEPPRPHRGARRRRAARRAGHRRRG